MVQPANDPLPILVESFSKDGLPVYSFAQDNHVFWDTCNCDGCCNPDMEDDSPKQKRKSSDKKLKARYNQGDRQLTLWDNPLENLTILSTILLPLEHL